MTQVDDKYVFCDLTTSMGCGSGLCAMNGTDCQCEVGFTHDIQFAKYPNCYAPTWVNVSYPASVSVLAAFFFAVSLNEFRKSKTVAKRRIYSIICLALVCTLAYALSRIGTGMNEVAWVFFLLQMAIHLFGLAPTLIRNFIPSIFRAISGYPGWVQVGLGSWYTVSAVMLSFIWVYGLIGLATNNDTIFNDSAGIWLVTCAWLFTQLLLMIHWYVSHIERTFQRAYSSRDPQYTEMNMLLLRARKFRNIAGILGMLCILFLIIASSLHFHQNVYGYQFVIGWTLEVLTLVFIYQIIWYFKTTPSVQTNPTNELTLPKSSFNIEMPPHPDTPVGIQRSRFRSEDSFVDVAVV